jgi:hypothetical protein
MDAEAGRLLGDPSHTRWTTDVLHTRYELAQQDVQAQTGAVKTVETLTPTVDTAEVTVDTAVLDIKRVTLTESDGTITNLEGRSREDLDFYDPTWPNLDPGKPKTWYFDASNRQVVLVPAPSSTYAIANALKVWEVCIPTALSGDSSEPFDANALMKAYHMAVVYWIVAQCLMDNTDAESLAKSKFYRTNDIMNPGEYEKVLKQINGKFDHPTAIPSRIQWQPQGGRRSRLAGSSTKENILGV